MVDTDGSKVLIDIDTDLKPKTAEGIRKEQEKKQWNLKQTIIDILNRLYNKSKIPFKK